MLLLALAALLVSVPAAILFLHATTDGGKLTAVAILCGIGGAGLFMTLPLLLRRRFAAVLGIAAVAASGVLFHRAYSLTPDGATPDDAAFQSIFLGERGYVRWSLANLVPEVDQFDLGSRIVRWIDPFIDEAKAERIRDLFHAVYGEMSADPEFLAAGSTMNYAYRHLFGGDWDSEHLYLYVPGDARRPAPVLLFLHGSGGNFKGYMWVLKKIADQTGCAVVAPDFGFGVWDHPRGVAVVRRARDFIADHPSLDVSRVYLAGLSNGGLGVTRAALADPDQWRALIYFSGVIEDARMRELGGALAAGETPVFIIHGEADQRIAIRYIDSAVASLGKTGVPVVLKRVPDEDHFLFFSRRDLVESFAAAAIFAPGLKD